MRFDDFVRALVESGWRDTNDAQHTNIKKLWEKMYPVLAQVEQELFEAECRLEDRP